MTVDPRSATTARAPRRAPACTRHPLRAAPAVTATLPAAPLSPPADRPRVCALLRSWTEPL